MTQTDTAMLSTKNLCIGYGKKVIGENINLEAHSNEMVCLLGQNGVGKSTLLRTLSNLQEPLAGNVLIEGNEINNLSHQELSRVLGIVTTDKIGIQNMTVRELVSLGRYPYTNWLGKLGATDRAKVEESIALCKVDYIADKKMSDLSDGQRQKAMIARVLAQDTRIVLLDEPTAHLDLINRAEIMKLLSEIKKNRCVIISTHELSLSMQFADKLWLMNFNQPMETGTPEDLALGGQINRSFHEQEFEIDLLTGNVQFHNQSIRKINLIGGGAAFEWTKHALKRIGYELDESSEKLVEVKAISGQLSWRFTVSNHSVSGFTLEALIKELQKP
ncbi:ABC transporter ATP-binding protein [Reichenbachiella sp. MALMAid0571]|uniref:ABC transporter ATP-binding protein n=1 Tax=Reichenbachiella sp. MALMAid0571 TaxID=3143939 RepID=UPI0032E044EF